MVGTAGERTGRPIEAARATACRICQATFRAHICFLRSSAAAALLLAALDPAKAGESLALMVARPSHTAVEHGARISRDTVNMACGKGHRGFPCRGVARRCARFRD